MSIEGKAYKKISPFQYPSKKHQRTEAPPFYTDYRKYRPYLKKEFGGRCVYCCKVDFDHTFHVEHYRPKGQFPQLKNAYSNLLYSCASCNQFKSLYWCDAPEKKVLNPCDLIMTQHLGFAGEMVEARSVTGAFNLELIRLNNDESIAYRRHAIDSIILLIRGILRNRNTSNKSMRNSVDKAIGVLSNFTGRSDKSIRKVMGV